MGQMLCEVVGHETEKQGLVCRETNNWLEKQGQSREKQSEGRGAFFVIRGIWESWMVCRRRKKVTIFRSNCWMFKKLFLCGYSKQ